ncbi:hypothetical protein BDV93DRAFT_595836 [Ceratobasidium sp. AG-I]|nr:hypothetical protein BDV93DRAFT_595836 [Ceratobasidium sp. AG-I]
MRQTRARYAFHPACLQNQTNHFDLMQSHSFYAEYAANITTIIDQGLESVIARGAGGIVSEEHEWVDACFNDLSRMYDALRAPGHDSLKTALRGPPTGMNFRNELNSSGSRIDPLYKLGNPPDERTIASHFDRTFDNGHSLRANRPLTGAQTVAQAYLRLRHTTDSNRRLRQPLRDNITDAPHDEIFLEICLFMNDQKEISLSAVADRTAKQQKTAWIVLPCIKDVGRVIPAFPAPARGNPAPNCQSRTRTRTRTRELREFAGNPPRPHHCGYRASMQAFPHAVVAVQTLYELREGSRCTKVEITDLQTHHN